jgi:hypothetical protein
LKRLKGKPRIIRHKCKLKNNPTKSMTFRVSVVVLACNPSYSGGGDGRFEASLGKS